MSDLNRPIRVMRIIARLNIGGPAIHVVLLSERIGPPEFESTLVCGQIDAQEGDMSYLAEERGVSLITIPELGRSLSFLRDGLTLFKLWRLMRRVRPDIVHTHTAKAGFVGRTAAWLARVPVRVHTFHGHVFHGYFSPFKTRVFLGLERLTARLSDRLITISPALKEELAHTYHIAPEDKFVVVPLGLELAPFAATPRRGGAFRAEHGIPPEAPLIGIVGRLVPIKNHQLFLEMAARMQKKTPQARFVIVGEGECLDAVQAQVDALKLRRVVTFAGWLRDLRPVYSDLDVLVISSDNEGTPVSLIEALAAGTPVVSTAVGGVPDLLQGGMLGRLVPPGNPDALAEAVQAALEAPEPTSDSARQSILALYDITRLCDDLTALYRNLLETKPKTHRP